jgi:hypothetical protein
MDIEIKGILEEYKHRLLFRKREIMSIQNAKITNIVHNHIHTTQLGYYFLNIGDFQLSTKSKIYTT